MPARSTITPIEDRTPHSIVGASQFDITSAEAGRYRIYLYIPPLPAPARGFPILYLLDGNATFATAADAVALQMRRPEATGVAASVIAGVGYPVDTPLDMERRRFDYTPPKMGALAGSGSGGAAQFWNFIETQLKPTMETIVPIDRGRQALFGHSFGGLFALWALFARSGGFQAYAAASPSIWWDDECILAYESAFAARARQGIVDEARVLLTVGSLEHRSKAKISADGTTDMVKDVTSMAQRLGSLAPDRLRVKSFVFGDENHASVVPAAISRSLRFV
ncbi:MAG: alpha/beta hydrolase [Pseudorhodoplanes sp.]|uniref:alpha/beta hydrolase n=1 Tax=Pseudorhodoplanes sp. TaxID=1934341 RepID=UPI003D14A223